MPDEHAHAPNERLNLDNFYQGVLAAAYLWQELAALSFRAPVLSFRAQRRIRYP